MSPGNNFLGHFIIIDIGHPMAIETVLIIKQSLKNILLLALNIRDISRIPAFGCGVLAPFLQIISPWKILTGNFSIIDHNLEYLTNSLNIGGKVTIKDYRSILQNSIERIIHDFELNGNEWKSNTKIKEKFNPQNYWPIQMQLTLITKKRGSLILEMLKNFQNYSSKLKKIEIIEIRNDNDIENMINHSNFISCIIITENIHYLDGIIKRWITGEETKCEQLDILINNESGLCINCEIHDCLINPGITTLPQTLFLSAMSPTIISSNPLYLTVDNQSIHKMEIINKIGINDLCPSTIFGFPKWIHSKKNHSNQILFNDELFQALSTQLYTDQIGLITRLISSSSYNTINPLYFIISDGIKLLMMNIAPMELQLNRPFIISPMMNIRQEASDVIRSLIGQMKIDKISPQSMSIGIYQHFEERLKSGFQKPGKSNITKAKYIKPKPIQQKNISPGEYIPKFLKIPTTSPILSKKSNSQSHNDEPIHPALMSPEKMAKYRKYNSNHYQLPEIMEPGMMDL